MEEKKLVPKLRFPGFTEPWEQRKFGELFLERREKTTEENEDILLSCAITGIYLNSDLFSHFRGSSTVGYLKVRKNDLILSAQNLHLGNANINFNFEHGMISPAYKVFEIESCDPYFVNAWVKKDSTKIFFLKVTTEGASQCRKNIDWDALINQDLLTPNAFEQEAIGKFFYQLDRYITLHQRKLEHLKLKKKSLLQKLFPKEGEVYPELRFPGFTDPWEQRKFGDLFEYERPDAYIVKSDNYNNDFNMPVLTANKAFILGYTNEENSYNKPSIIFDDFTLDRKYVDFPYMLKSSAIKILTSKNQHNLRFLFERLNSTRFEVLGHARHYISVVQNTTTLCPSVDEEVCISNLLTKFDNLITLHQRKLEHLQLLKKALLQQLFV